MHNVWPLGQLPPELQRPELAQLRQQGYTFDDPWQVIDIFERKVADFAGSQYAVAVDCCSHGLFLCLKYLQASGEITVPKKTYVSVPMQILHAGCTVRFEDIAWTGKYQLDPYPIWDAATMWRSNMYESGFQVVSFQIKKHIPIGRGGMILTNDEPAYRWFKKACHDGRDMEQSYLEDDFAMVGWHYYMTPEDAARGILLMDHRNDSFPDIWSEQNYHDLSYKTVFRIQK
jgi:dTDP-4-amino-4,6-dideoxygalactose transaminase